MDIVLGVHVKSDHQAQENIVIAHVKNTTLRKNENESGQTV